MKRLQDTHFFFFISAIRSTNIPLVALESRTRLIPYTSFHLIIHQSHYLTLHSQKYWRRR